MKWFFYGLLAANAALFGWIYWHPLHTSASQSSAIVPQTGNRLTLLHELPKLPPARVAAATPTSAPKPPPPAPVPIPAAVANHNPAPAPAPVPAPAAKPKEASKATAAPVRSAAKSHCLRIAEFTSEADAIRAARRLQHAGARIRARGKVSSTDSRYWIILPPFRSAKAAHAALAQLQRSGLKDYYLVRSGDNKNAISLGVYSSHDAARRRYREIRDLKFHPRIQEISVPTVSWWVDFDWPAGKGERWREALNESDRALPVAACR